MNYLEEDLSYDINDEPFNNTDDFDISDEGDFDFSVDDTSSSNEASTKQASTNDNDIEDIDDDYFDDDGDFDFKVDEVEPQQPRQDNNEDIDDSMFMEDGDFDFVPDFGNQTNPNQQQQRINPNNQQIPQNQNYNQQNQYRHQVPPNGQPNQQFVNRPFQNNPQQFNQQQNQYRQQVPPTSQMNQQPNGQFNNDPFNSFKGFSFNNDPFKAAMSGAFNAGQANNQPQRQTPFGQHSSQANNQQAFNNDPFSAFKGMEDLTNPNNDPFKAAMSGAFNQGRVSQTQNRPNPLSNGPIPNQNKPSNNDPFASFEGMDEPNKQNQQQTEEDDPFASSANGMFSSGFSSRPSNLDQEKKRPSVGFSSGGASSGGKSIDDFKSSGIKTSPKNAQENQKFDEFKNANTVSKDGQVTPSQTNQNNKENEKQTEQKIATSVPAWTSNAWGGSNSSLSSQSNQNNNSDILTTFDSEDWSNRNDPNFVSHTARQNNNENENNIESEFNQNAGTNFGSSWGETNNSDILTTFNSEDWANRNNPDFVPHTQRANQNIENNNNQQQVEQYDNSGTNFGNNFQNANNQTSNENNLNNTEVEFNQNAGTNFNMNQWGEGTTSIFGTSGVVSKNTSGPKEKVDPLSGLASTSSINLNKDEAKPADVGTNFDSNMWQRDSLSASRVSIGEKFEKEKDSPFKDIGGSAISKTHKEKEGPKSVDDLLGVKKDNKEENKEKSATIKIKNNPLKSTHHIDPLTGKKLPSAPTQTKPNENKAPTKNVTFSKTPGSASPTHPSPTNKIGTTNSNVPPRPGMMNKPNARPIMPNNNQSPSKLGVNPNHNKPNINRPTITSSMPSNSIPARANMNKPGINPNRPNPNGIRPNPNVPRPNPNGVRPSPNGIRPNGVRPNPNAPRPNPNGVRPTPKVGGSTTSSSSIPVKNKINFNK